MVYPTSPLKRFVIIVTMCHLGYLGLRDPYLKDGNRRNVSVSSFISEDFNRHLRLRRSVTNASILKSIASSGLFNHRRYIVRKKQAICCH